MLMPYYLRETKRVHYKLLASLLWTGPTAQIWASEAETFQLQLSEFDIFVGKITFALSVCLEYFFAINKKLCLKDFAKKEEQSFSEFGGGTAAVDCMQSSIYKSFLSPAI